MWWRCTRLALQHMLACGASLLAPAAPPPDGCIRLHWPLFDLVTHCPKAFLVAGGIVGRVLPLTRGALVCCGCIRPQATRAKHKEGKFALTKTGLDTSIKKGKASAPKVESIKQPSPKAEKLPKVKFEKGKLIMDVKANIIKMMSRSVVSKAISVKSIYYYTHDDGTQEIKRAKDMERHISVRYLAQIAQIAQIALRDSR